MTGTTLKMKTTFRLDDVKIASLVSGRNIVIGPYQYYLAWGAQLPSFYVRIHVSLVTINHDGGMTLTPVDCWYGISDAERGALRDANQRANLAAQEAARIAEEVAYAQILINSNPLD